jgi:hypothetical protein
MVEIEDDDETEEDEELSEGEVCAGGREDVDARDFVADADADVEDARASATCVCDALRSASWASLRSLMMRLRLDDENETIARGPDDAMEEEEVEEEEHAGG